MDDVKTFTDIEAVAYCLSQRKKSYGEDVYGNDLTGLSALKNISAELAYLRAENAELRKRALPELVPPFLHLEIIDWTTCDGGFVAYLFNDKIGTEVKGVGPTPAEAVTAAINAINKED